jgi:hypothetical protein
MTLPSDQCAIVSGTSDKPLLYLTVDGVRARLILVNINPAYRTVELAHALRLSGCAALVFTSRFKSSDYSVMLESLLPELATARTKSMKPRAASV